MSIHRPPDLTNRSAWVDFAKGFCIVAVVGMWVAAEMQNYQTAGHAGWLGYFVSFAKPFRMPDFFLISGLFLSRVIDRPWRQYLDTKVVHYAYFMVLWTLILVSASWLLGRDLPTDALDAAGQLALYLVYEPFANLWFLMFLAIYFVATRLLRNVPMPLVLLGGALMMVFPLNTHFYPIDRFGVYFLYFYAGHALSKFFFQLADWALVQRRLAWLALAVWAPLNAVAVKWQWTEDLFVLNALGFAGICAVVIVSSQLARSRAAAWVRHLGEHSIVVYLGFYLPMIIIVPALRASAVGDSDHLVATVALISCVVLPVMAHQVALRIGLRWLYERPDWAKLVRKPAFSGGRTTGRLPAQGTRAASIGK